MSGVLAAELASAAELAVAAADIRCYITYLHPAEFEAETDAFTALVEQYPEFADKFATTLDWG